MSYTVVPGGAVWIALGDFDENGSVDLAVAGGGCVSILLGKGDGTFSSVVKYATGGSPVSVTTGDFNLDGKPDLAVTDSNTNLVTVLTNTTRK